MKFWAFQPTASDEEIDLLVYGYIAETAVWSEAVGAREFRQALAEHAAAKRINVRINSGGGDAFAGIAIHAMLQAHPAEVVCHVEGLAGSAASLIAMAGTRTIMARGSMIMIHNPSALAMGEADDLRQTADVLDKLRDSLVAIYQAKTGKAAAELQTLLDAETWLTADEAVAEGFADEVAGQPVTATAKGDAVFFNSVSFPRAAAPPLAEPETAKDTKPVDEPPPTAETAKDPAPVQQPVALTRELLAQQAPSLLAALLDEGGRAERARQQAIDEVALPGHETLVARARYEQPISAEQLALQIMRAEKANRANYLDRSRADALEAVVPPSPLSPGGADEETRTVKAMAAGGTQRRTR